MNFINSAFVFLLSTAVAAGGSVPALDMLRGEQTRLEEENRIIKKSIENNEITQNNIKSEINEIDMALSDMQVEIDSLNEKENELLIAIDDAKQKYETARKSSKDYIRQVEDRLCFLYENDINNIKQNLILRSRSLTEYKFLKQYAKDIIEYDTGIIEKLRENEKLMKGRFKEIISDKEAKKLLENFRSEKEFDMAVLLEKKNNLLKKYRRNKDMMETELIEKISAAEKVNEIINSMNENYDFVSRYTGGMLEWPVPGRYYVSSDYEGRERPIGSGSEFHTGIDIPAPEGYEVCSAEDGIVINDGWINGYGNTVIINHGNGISTLYAHNSEIVVHKDDKVKRGEIIALCGSTGKSTGNHCHFEVRVNGSHTNPWDFLEKKCKL